MSRKCLVIDVDRCSGCFSCQVACKYANDLTLGQNWNRVLTVGPVGTFPDVSMYYLPLQCQQCENAPCVSVCPTGASYRADDGVVLIDKEKCIGCQYCMMACPYGVRHLNEEQKVVEKCTLCYQDTSAGGQPACVSVCCSKARYYGDLDDPDSDVSIALKNADPASIHTLPDKDNGPLTKYIFSPKYGEWVDLERGVI